MKNYFNYFRSLIISVLFIFTSCEDEDIEPLKSDMTEIIEYKILGQEADIQLNNNTSILITFPSDVTTADNLSAKFVLSEGAVATVNNALQESGITENNFEIPFIYKITAEDNETTNNWKVSSINNNYTTSWGLGGFQKSTVSNNKDYEWYIDQAYTGTSSFENCGPTSTTMAAKWSDSGFSYDTEYARSCYRPNGGWWYTSDIHSYLTDNGISHRFITLSDSPGEGTFQLLKEQIDDGKIAILCVDMYYITKESNTQVHVDKFYNTNTTGWGHFIVAKGYKIVDGQNFLEIYDPYGNSKTYSDNTPKGKNRYYRSEDIYKATSNWWNNAIIVSEKNKGFKNGKFIESNKIKHMWGR